MSASSEPLRVGVVGTGAFGSRHVRVLSGLSQADLVGVFDTRPEAAERMAREHSVRVWPSLEELCGEVEAVVLAVPTVLHAEIGCALLERGLHLLVEKPIAASLAEADRLVAAQGDRVLAVGHVEFFNPAVQALLELDSPPRFVEVHRLATFTPRSLDVDVLLDLMIHDLQILHALDPSPVAEVRATGIEVLTARTDIANARIALASGCVANLTASRVSGDRVRKLRIFSSNSYYSLDYHEQRIDGVTLRREGDEKKILPVRVPVEKREPLKLELEAFVAACRGEPATVVDGRRGRQALATALAVGEAMGASGQFNQEAPGGES